MISNEEIFSLLKEIVQNKQEKEINIFLCGKDSSDKNSLRERINIALHKYSKINVLYPEWLFHNMLEQTDYDLLSLETKLASDVDKIILPLEGYGTFCELGSFVMNEEIRKKMVVINDIDYEGKKTFINLGPLRLIKKSTLGEVIYISLKQQQIIVDLIERKLKFTRSKEFKTLDFSNLFALTYLVGLIILVYQPITKRYLEYIIRQFDKSIVLNYLDATIEFLIKKEQIETSINERNEETFLMSIIGKNDYEMSFQQINKQKTYYKVRNIALWTKPENRYKFSISKEKARLLENTK
jgi:hypothetical protein